MDSNTKGAHAHVVPRAYLRNFADANRMIGMRLVDNPALEISVSVRDAAVRSHFYRRPGPDGTALYDVERMLGLIEGPAAPILRGIEQRWPLSFDDKRVLGELFALQVLRSPRWRQGYEARSRLLLREYQVSGLFAEEIALTDRSADEVFEQTCQLVTSDSFRLRRMLGMSSKGSSIFGSMTWALIRFPTPTLATADHPVTGWSRYEARTRPKPTPEGAGWINMLEVRVPVSPTAAILMMWLDQPDDVTEPIDGGRREARNINAFTLAQAEKQWFHLPGTPPSIGNTRAYSALSIELFPGYDRGACERSAIRNTVSTKVNEQLGEETNEYEIVRPRAAAQ